MSELVPENPTTPAVQPVTTTPTVASPVTPTQLTKSSKKGLMIVSLLVLLALVGVVGLFFFLQNQNQEIPTPPAVTTPTPEIKTLVMQVDSLSDHQVVATKVLKVTGKTNVPATVSITGGTDDVVVDSTSTFATDVTLNPGDNVLSFTAVDGDENQKLLILNILFTDEVLP